MIKKQKRKKKSKPKIAPLTLAFKEASNIVLLFLLPSVLTELPILFDWLIVRFQLKNKNKNE